MTEASARKNRTRRAERTIFLVLPAYNEALGIGSLLHNNEAVNRWCEGTFLGER